jgi:mannose-6-phosphate isomerase
VLRAGLTDKHVDKPELLATVEFAIMYPQVLRPDYVGIEQEIPIPVADFRLSFLRPDGQHPFSVGGQGEIELLYGLRGQMTLTAADGETWSLGPADALLLPGGGASYTLSGKGKLAWARVNQ